MADVYAATICAVKRNGSVFTTGIYVGYQLGPRSKEESIGYALKLGYERLPSDENWTDHQVATVLIPEHVLREALGLPVEDGGVTERQVEL